MASFVNMSGKAPERSNFAKTCNLLSQYLKGRCSSLGDVCQLGIDGKLESKGPETSRPPAAAAVMNMLPSLEKVYDPHHNEDSSSIGKSAQMTIFYGGQVTVFNDFPADKAKQIMSLASNSNGLVPASAREVHNPKSPAANNAPDQLHLRPQANGSGLPIARRASLHRFLEKRKDRITSKAPYQINSPPASTSKLIEPIPGGNLPAGFDTSTCRSVYVGNIHTQVTEPLLREVFASTGPVEGCKLIRKEKSSFGFIHYFDRRSAAIAILSLNGRHLFGQPIKVNWAYTSGQREDTSGHYNIFVGDLSPEVTDAMLFACFSVYPSCSDAKVMWDQKTGRSRGFGFVSFRTQQDAQSAINDLTGKWLGSRQIRCNWATKGAGTNEDKQSSDAKSVVELTNVTSEDGKETTNSEAPENNSQYTTVYVGNLAPEVTQLNLHCHFHALGAGVIEEVRVQRDKGFGFVRYSTHAEAALAIQIGNAQSLLCGRQIKCSWGSKPTPPGTSSNPLPPPAAAPLPGISATDILAYERQLAMGKMGGVHTLLHPQSQHPLKQAAMGMGAARTSQAINEGGLQNVAAAQQLMYYQ